jgi:cytochrome c biogenesis protein
VSAERGYLRETGNLLFHVSLVVLLAGIAMGGLFGFKAEIIRTPGVGWSNVLGQYDEQHTGRAFSESSMSPFTVTFQKFQGVYLPSGAPKSYDAYVSYTEKPGGPVRQYDIRENHPLVLGGSWLTGGTKVYLGGHGFAPHVTLTAPDGTRIPYDDVVFLPTETTNYKSEGYFKVTNVPDGTKPFAVHGVFAPSPGLGSLGELESTSPVAKNPELQVNALSGDPTAETVYDVPAGMPALKGTDGTLSRGLHVGDSYTLTNGYTVTFTGWSEFANFQVTDDPGKRLAFVAAVLIVVGLLLSLRVRRRRVWVRARRDDAGRTVVEAGGLARTDQEQFADEFADLCEQLAAGTSQTSGQPQPMED